MKSAPKSISGNTLLIVSILVLIILIIDMYVLYSTYTFKKNRESCPCAITPNTHKIMFMVSILVSVGLISSILIPVISYLFNTDRKNLAIGSSFIGFIMYLIGIYYAYLLINYTNELKDNKCGCVSENFKYYIHNYGIFRMVLSILPLAFILVALSILLFSRLFL